LIVDRRIVGLDAWRAFLLLGGPLTHAALMMAKAQPNYEMTWSIIQWSTHLFRMEAFFFISGIVSSLSQVRRPGWVWSRIIQLGLPLVTVWIVIMIPLVTMTNHMNGDHVKLIAPQHLWFLYVLILMALLAAVANDWLNRIASVIDQQNIVIVLSVWMIISALLASSVPLANEYVPTKKLVIAFFTDNYSYGSYYLAGALFSRCPILMDQVRRTRFWWIGLVVSLVSLALYSYGYESFNPASGDLVGRCAIEATVAISSVTMCVCVTHTSFRMTNIPTLVWRFSRTSFTVYLMHLPILELLFLLPGTRGANPAVLFFLASYTCLSLSVALHILMARFMWFRILFNGKIEGPLRVALDRFIVRRLPATSTMIEDRG
jgi:glucan biosynthesis protein C